MCGVILNLCVHWVVLVLVLVFLRVFVLFFMLLLICLYISVEHFKPRTFRNTLFNNSKVFNEFRRPLKIMQINNLWENLPIQLIEIIEPQSTWPSNLLNKQTTFQNLQNSIFQSFCVFFCVDFN